MSDDLAQVVGQRNVDKMGEITMTALGYSNGTICFFYTNNFASCLNLNVQPILISEEECVCCPCLPASQTLLIIMLL